MPTRKTEKGILEQIQSNIKVTNVKILTLSKNQYIKTKVKKIFTTVEFKLYVTKLNVYPQ